MAPPISAQRTATKQQIGLATSNAGKVRELSAMLAPFQLQICPQSDFGVSDAEETGLTFVENALIKARHASQITGMPAIADDSGLAVDALHGAPGIYSARYAGLGASDNDNLRHLLRVLEGVEESERGACFHCVLVYLRHAADPTPLICHGQWCGRILNEPRGSNGFGYDPLFWVDSYNCTSAELPPAIKNQLSHRGQALAKLVKALRAGA